MDCIFQIMTRKKYYKRYAYIEKEGKCFKEFWRSTDSEWLGNLFSTMVYHQADAQIQEAACRSIANHITANPSLCSLIGEESNLIAIHSSVMAALNIHIKDSYVFQAACCAIFEMAIHSRNLQQYLIIRGAYLSILHEMKEMKGDVEIHTFGYHALRALAYQNPLQEEVMFKYGLLSLIEHDLQYFKDLPLLKESICLLTSLANNLEIVRRQCLHSLLPQCILNIVHKHQNDARMVEVGMEAIAVFCASEENKLRKIENIRILCDVMYCNESNEMIQQKGFIIMQLMVTDEEFVKSNEIANEIVQSVIKSLSSHQDVQVHTECCVLLILLLEGEEVFRKAIKLMAIQKNLHESLFHLLEYYNSEDSIYHLLQQCLAELCSEQEISNTALQTACTLGYHKCAEFMICLNAEVDTEINGIEPPLCLAAKRTNLKLINLLLSLQPTHICNALAISLKEGLYEVAGALLRHLGYEKRSDSISWSAVNIDELIPDILFATIACANEIDDEFIKPSTPALNNNFTFVGRRKRAATLAVPSEIKVEELRPRSSSSVFVDSDKRFNNERNLATVSGVALPFNSLDPRLDKQEPLEKHFVMTSPTQGLCYPGHPDVALISEPFLGNLVSPEKNIQQNLTPVRSPRRRKFRKSLSENNILGTGQRCNSVVQNQPRTPPPSKMKRYEGTRDRTQSCLPTFLDTIVNNIKLLDVSHNNINNLVLLGNCSTPNIVAFLHHLTYIDISYNKLENVPNNFYCKLKNLKSLSISHNQLTVFPYALFSNPNIEILDISSNQISSIDPKKVTLSLSLLKLDISNNNLTEFPVWISEVFPRLNKLFISQNNIKTIPENAKGFRGLQELKMSRNKLKSLPGTFVSQCTSLERIDLSFNELETLPEYAPSTLSRLMTIKISHNKLNERKPFFIPKILLATPSLQFLDISHNKITELPDPSCWSSRCIRELRFNDNGIKCINIGSNAGTMWPVISRLNLSCNSISHLPPAIGQLITLTSLDLSYNNITSLPDEIGRLTQLYEFSLSGLKLKLDQALSKASPHDIVSFFSSKLKNAVKYRRIKLMLVGGGGRGKTSLVRQLAFKKHPTYNVATAGVDVSNWVLSPSLFSNNKDIVMNTWDFAGQEDFYSTHQYFLTSRALYLAVFDASKGVEEINALTPWLLNIQAVAPESVVILVGTHADKIPKENRQRYIDNLLSYADEYLNCPGFPEIRKKAIVHCMKENKAMESLRDKIFEIISSFKYEGESIIEQMVPKSYLDLEDVIQKESRNLTTNKLLPIVTKHRLWTLAVDAGILINKDEFDAALKFLKETGILMHFMDSKLNLSSLYFIDPQWLCKMMARIVTVKEINPYITPKGILSKEDAWKLFIKDGYPELFLERYFRLLQKFEILLPLSATKYLITSRLPASTPQYILSIQENLLSTTDIIHRRYVFPYIPNGMWNRLITRTLIYAEVPSEDEVSKKTQCDFWQTGIFMKWTKDIYFLLSLNPHHKNILDIFTPINKACYRILGCLVDLVDNLLEEWYPGLESDKSVERFSPCYSCHESKHYFPLESVVTASYEKDTVECPNCGPVLIQSVAPDVVFAEIDPNLLFHECQINFKNDDFGKLGSGSFASVYKVTKNGVNLAVKIFNDTKNGPSPNRLLRQELDILIKLNHPCLITFVGVMLRPRMVLLEYAPLGNLQTKLDSGRALSRGMQHRIALQISEGLEYLHSFNIVYRDLKPSNVLVFSLSMGVLVNVKLTDYGISQFSGVMGLNACRGTPGHQAPEVTNGESEYNLEVDIFSFGVTLYEIITGGKQPYGDLPYQNEFDLAVLSNKPIDNPGIHGCAPWPDMEYLISQCLSAKPDERPNINDVRLLLSSVDLLCLQREAAICKDQSVECLTVRKYREDNNEKLELWIGSGEAGSKSQLSWLPLGSGRKQTIQGLMVTEGRILCVQVIKNHVIVGTKEGYVIAYDCQTKARSHQLQSHKDSVLCLHYVSKYDILLIGLANGQLCLYQGKDLKTKDVRFNYYTYNIDIDGEHPIACITTVRNNILIGYGQYVLEISLDNFELIRYFPVSSKKNIVSNIILCKQWLYISCKDESIVQVFDYIDMSPDNPIDCFEILRDQDPGITKKECRVVSITSAEKESLWIGCGDGHIIVIDITNGTHTRLTILHRHTSAVRSFAVAPKLPGKSCSVISGSMGYRHINDGADNESNFGYIIVWDSELTKHQKHLEVDIKKREELAKQMALN